MIPVLVRNLTGPLNRDMCQILTNWENPIRPDWISLFVQSLLSVPYFVVVQTVHFLVTLIVVIFLPFPCP